MFISDLLMMVCVFITIAVNLLNWAAGILNDITSTYYCLVCACLHLYQLLICIMFGIYLCVCIICMNTCVIYSMSVWVCLCSQVCTHMCECVYKCVPARVHVLLRTFPYTVELVYNGHLGNSKVSRLSRCPDFPGHFM